MAKAHQQSQLLLLLVTTIHKDTGSISDQAPLPHEALSHPLSAPCPALSPFLANTGCLVKPCTIFRVKSHTLTHTGRAGGLTTDLQDTLPGDAATVHLLVGFAHTIANAKACHKAQAEHRPHAQADTDTGTDMATVCPQQETVACPQWLTGTDTRMATPQILVPLRVLL